MAWKREQALTEFDQRMFRELNDEEEAEFRQYARDNKEEIIGLGTLAHPVCRDEVAKNSS